MYRTVQFVSSYPNEWSFNDKGDPLAPGARDLAEAIVTELRGHLPLVTMVEQHEYYGWGFHATCEGSRFYNVLNPADQCYLTVTMRAYYTKALLLRRPRRTFDRYCAILTSALQELPKVS